MKVIKTPAKPALKDRFTVGTNMVFALEQFDGRGYTTTYVRVKIVKVNRVTVDVEKANGTVWRLEGREIDNLLVAKPKDPEYYFDGRNGTWI